MQGGVMHSIRWTLRRPRANINNDMQDGGLVYTS